MSDQKTISIYGNEIPVSAPYAEGQTITAIEAKVLNQTRAENIANNFRKSVKDAMDKKDDPAALTAVLAEIAKYDAEYSFTAGGIARTPIDPVEREATAIARQVIKTTAKEKNIKFEDIPTDKYDAMLERLVKSEDVVKRAKARVKAKEAEKAAGKDAIADLF